MAVSPAGSRGSVHHYAGRSAMRPSSLLLALVATIIVTVVPVAVVWLLREDALIGSAFLGVGLAVAVSLGLAWLAEFAWSKRREANDAVFSELLLWGWLRRLRVERRLAHAEELLEELEVGHEGPGSIRHGERLLGQLVTALEAQDAYLDGHSRRVARHATMIARQMGLPRGEIRRVRAAAAIHDVGKLNVPLDVLNKPGRLTEEEFELIKRHPVDGEAIVSGLGDPDLDSIVRHHHERLDGRGYPDGWSGERIPLGARIVAVADTFDAVTSTRAYRGAAPQRQALHILREVSGTQLDPEAVQAFLRYYAGRRPITLWAMLVSWFGMRWQRATTALGAGPVSAAKIALLTAASAAVGFSAYGIAHSAAPPSVADAAALPPQTAPFGSATYGLGAGALGFMRSNAHAEATRATIRRAASAASASRRQHHRRSRRQARAGRLALSRSSATAGLPGRTTPTGSSGGSGTAGGSGTRNSGGAGSGAGTSSSSPVVSAPTTPPGSPTSSSAGGNPGGGGGTPGSQGLAHGRGPGGNGPPGLTGQNPGLSGAPPPGQAKKH